MNRQALSGRRLALTGVLLVSMFGSALATLPMQLARADFEYFFSDPAIWTTSVDLQPQVTDGGVEAYRIVWIRSGSFVQAAGLMAEDRITHINGQAIRQAENLAAEMANIQANGKASLMLQRGDKLVVMNYQLY